MSFADQKPLGGDKSFRASLIDDSRLFVIDGQRP